MLWQTVQFLVHAGTRMIVDSFVAVPAASSVWTVKYSGSWVSNSELDCGQLRLWSWVSLEWIKQSTSEKWRYEPRNYDFFHIRWKQFRELWCTNKNDLDLWPTTLIFNRVRAVVKCSFKKYDQAKCSGSWVIVHTTQQWTQHLHSRVMSLELRWCITSEFSPVRISFQLTVFS